MRKPIGSENETATGLHWYAVWSRSRHEKMVVSTLTSVGVTAFLPLVTEMHRWSDRRKSVDVLRQDYPDVVNFLILDGHCALPAADESVAISIHGIGRKVHALDEALKQLA